MGHRNARRRPRDLDVAALGPQHARLSVGPPAQGAERLVELGGRPGTGGRKVDVEVSQPVAAIVVVAAELQNLQALLDQVYEWQETVALQTVLVEIVGLAVGGGYDRDA